MTYDTGKPARRLRRRRLWPLALALWATAGVSPCALAATIQLDCLHCPSEMTGAGHDQHGSGRAHSAAGHHDEAAGCDGECDGDDGSLVDTRGGKSTPKDSGQPIAIAGPPVDLARRFIARTGSNVDPPAVAPGPGIRLHRLYCVYRD